MPIIGHKDFILCLGYRADAVKNYFLNYNECVSNNFVLANGGRDVRLLNSDIHDWNITFVDTGLSIQHRPAAQGRRAIPGRREDVPGQLQPTD